MKSDWCIGYRAKSITQPTADKDRRYMAQFPRYLLLFNHYFLPGLNEKLFRLGWVITNKLGTQPKKPHTDAYIYTLPKLIR